MYETLYEPLTAARIAVGIGFLAWASVEDVRTRRVRDSVWVVLGTLALIFVLVQLGANGARWEYYLILVPTAILFYDVFWEREALYDEGKFSFAPVPLALFTLSFVIMAWLLASFNGDPAFLQLFTMPVMILVCYALYYTRLLRGGADAKALICVSMLLPYYPVIFNFPLIGLDARFLEVASVLFPFALVVLMDAAILFLFSPLVFLFYNLKRGNASFPECLFGYRVGLDRVPRFSWLMESVENGEVRLSLFPKKREDKKEMMRQLRECGLKEVWVTPQIPFILPLTFGFLLAFALGNIFLGLVMLLG